MVDSGHKLEELVKVETGALGSFLGHGGGLGHFAYRRWCWCGCGRGLDMPGLEKEESIYSLEGRYSLFLVQGRVWEWKEYIFIIYGVLIKDRVSRAGARFLLADDHD